MGPASGCTAAWLGPRPPPWGQGCVPLQAPARHPHWVEVLRLELGRAWWSPRPAHLAARGQEAAGPGGRRIPAPRRLKREAGRGGSPGCLGRAASSVPGLPCPRGWAASSASSVSACNPASCADCRAPFCNLFQGADGSRAGTTQLCAFGQSLSVSHVRQADHTDCAAQLGGLSGRWWGDAPLLLSGWGVHTVPPRVVRPVSSCSTSP